MNLSELLGPVENPSPPLPHKAILWGANNLLAEAVEFFLKTRVEWELVRISCDRGVDYLIQQVQRVKPAVVILCQEKDTSDTALLMQLDQVESCLKVVILSMENNLIHVYSKHNVMMHDVLDLLAVIET
jgi:hypothetical protein